MADERLQKIMARAGIASRRACEDLIAAGRVRVNGRVVTELGTRAGRDDKVEVDGRRLVAEDLVYLVLNKPRGVMTTLSDPEGRPTVLECLKGVEARVFPVGRLDFQTSGALLFTNDGDFADGLMHPKRKVPKTYVVKVRGTMADADLDKWASGVDLEDGKTAPAQVAIIRHEPGKTWFEITIHEGRNQQIRRMGEATHFPVLRLARQSVGSITVEGLRPGAWRYCTRDELRDMQLRFAVPKKLPRTPEAEAPTRAPRSIERRRGGFERKGGAGHAAKADGAKSPRAPQAQSRAPQAQSEERPRGRAPARGRSPATRGSSSTRVPRRSR